MWTPEELAAMAAEDAEIEADFRMTAADYAASDAIDKAARNESRDNRQRAIAAYKKAYYEENKDAIAAYHKAWMKKNREKWNQYQREYRARKKEEQNGKADHG